MTSYRYNTPSTIESVTFRISDNGSKRAYLVAGANASEADIIKVVHAICEEGLYAIHSVCDGKPALEVRGYLREKSILDLLKKNDFAQGVPKVEKEEIKPASLLEKFRGRSLQATSGFFLAADACFAHYGYKEGHPEDVAAGIAYGMGSATMGLMGTNAQAVAEIKKQTKKLLAYTKEQGIDTSKSFTVPIVTENNKRDVFHQIVDTLQTYPTEIGNTMTSLAGALIAMASYKYKVKPTHISGGHSRASGYLDVGLGLCTVGSGTIGAWMKEKKHDPDVPYSQGFDGFKEWVLERPLSVAAFGYMCSTICHTFSTIIEHRKATKVNDRKVLDAVKWRGGFILCTLIGEALMMISSKGHGEGVKSDPSTEDSILSIAAEIIVQQKPALQAELISKFGDFLGRPDVLSGLDADIKKRLSQKVEAMRHNPWAHAVAVANGDAMPAKPATNTLGGWQQKLAVSQPVTPHLGV